VNSWALSSFDPARGPPSHGLLAGLDRPCFHKIYDFFCQKQRCFSSFKNREKASNSRSHPPSKPEFYATSATEKRQYDRSGSHQQWSTTVPPDDTDRDKAFHASARARPAPQSNQHVRAMGCTRRPAGPAVPRCARIIKAWWRRRRAAGRERPHRRN
jgi:hypothetical protein